MLKKFSSGEDKQNQMTILNNVGLIGVPGQSTKTQHIVEGEGIPHEGTTIHLMDPLLFNQLIIENRSLQIEIRELVDVIKKLVHVISEEKLGKEEIIEIREIPRQQAKKEIAELFQESETLYFSDIAERLCLDLKLVVELCSELEKEGKIKLKD